MWNRVAEEFYRSPTAFERVLGRDGELHPQQSSTCGTDQDGGEMAVRYREFRVNRPARRSGPTGLFLFLALLPARLLAIELDVPVFSGGYGTAFYEETARLFEQLRPGVTIKLYGDPRISDKIRVRMMDGNSPDVALPFNLLIPT